MIKVKKTYSIRMLCKCGTLSEYQSNNPLTKELACYLICPFCKPKNKKQKELNNG